jgi:hypothetical protein
MLKHILVNSLNDFAFLFIQFFLFLIRCGTLCPWGNTYAAKFYDLYIYLFIGYVLITFQAQFNLYMSVQRLGLFVKRRSHSQHNNSSSSSTDRMLNQWILLFFMVAFLVNAPIYLVSKEIKEIGLLWSNESNETILLYDKDARSAFKSSSVLQTLVAILILAKSCGFYVVTGCVNVLVALKFNEFIRKKRKVTTELSLGMMRIILSFNLIYFHLFFLN